jgi:hypothetical protein
VSLSRSVECGRSPLLDLLHLYDTIRKLASGAPLLREPHWRALRKAKVPPEAVKDLSERYEALCREARPRFCTVGEVAPPRVLGRIAALIGKHGFHDRALPPPVLREFDQAVRPLMLVELRLASRIAGLAGLDVAMPALRSSAASATSSPAACGVGDESKSLNQSERQSDSECPRTGGDDKPLQ